MSFKPVISVVIPVYNASKYISACLTSIIEQEISISYEIICVNDGSKDDSLDILKSFASEYSFIRVVDIPNGGATAARKEGVERAEGTWITFVDADDILPKHALRSLYGDGRNDFDIVVGEINSASLPFQGILSPEEYRIMLINSRIKPYPFAKLFRKELFDEKTFNIPREILVGEDLLMNVRVSFNLTKPVLFIDKNVYIYNRVPTSVSHTFIRTPHYEQMFQKYLLDSIPLEFRGNKEIMHAKIASEINAWKYMNLLNISTKRNRESDFFQELIKKIRNSGYPLKFTEKIQLNSHSLPLRLVALTLNIWPIFINRIKNCFSGSKFRND